MPFGSAEYGLAVELRRRILRLPLGLDFSAGELAVESDQHHLVAIQCGAAVGCLVLVGQGAEVKMRQVAVCESLQGSGIGALMVAESERMARELGFARMVLHARETAVGFYLRLGYACEGESFEEVGIPHRLMQKEL